MTLRPPPVCGAVGRQGHRHARGRGGAVPRGSRQAGIPGHRGSDGQAYGVPMTTLGRGGSIPLSNVFADTFPAAEIILMGTEEPQALIHARRRSVDPPRSRGWRWPRPSSSSATPAPASSPGGLLRQ